MKRAGFTDASEIEHRYGRCVPATGPDDRRRQHGAYVPHPAGQARTPGRACGIHEVDGPRHGELAATERRIGIIREVFFLADGGDHDRLVMYLEGESIGDSLGRFVASREPFDLWFKGRFATCTGVDLNDPPPLEPAELLAAYGLDESVP